MSRPSALDKLNVKLSDDMLAMASMIIQQKQITFAPEAFEDRYEEALLTLVRSKISGGQPIITKAPERGNVVNLMDALAPKHRGGASPARRRACSEVGWRARPNPAAKKPAAKAT